MRFCAFIFLLCYSHLSLALGLSDIELKSYLGETLNAQIDINDVDSPPDISCFVAKDLSADGANRRFIIALKESNNLYQLLISSRSAITEPIIEIRISYDCEPNINREYVLLVDPPSSVNNTVAATKLAATTDSSNLQNSDSLAKSKKPTAKSTTAIEGDVSGGEGSASINDDASAASSQAFNNTTTAKTTDAPKKKRAKKQAIRNQSSSVDDRLSEAYIGKTPASDKADAAQFNTTIAAGDSAKPPSTKASDKPYLVISGGNTDGNSASLANTQSGLVLRLETQIDFNRVADAPLSATDTMDEVTVMANRLTHLEQQILSLQTRNAQLKAEAEKAKNAGFNLSDTQYKWLHHIAVVLGIIVLLALAEALRRKILRNRLKRDESIWFVDHNNNEASAVSDGVLIVADAKINPAKIESAIFNELDFGDTDAYANGQNPSANHNQQMIENDIESVLDHAEVFIAHGRPALAIQLLQNHLDELPTESPAIWIKLLSLLATESTELEYEATVTECNQFFNIKLPKFGQATEPDDSSIEDYPHIVGRLEGVWGSQYATGFLNDLIYNQQSQPREGFARNTFEELFFLKQIAEILQSARFSSAATSTYNHNKMQATIEKVETNNTLFTPVAPALADIEQANLAKNLTKPPVYEPHKTIADDHQMVVEFNEPELEESTLNIDDDALIDQLEPKAADIHTAATLPALEHDNFADAPVLSDTIDFSVKDDTQADEITFAEIDFSADELEREFKKNSDKDNANKKKADDANSIEFDWDLPKIE